MDTNTIVDDGHEEGFKMTNENLAELSTELERYDVPESVKLGSEELGTAREISVTSIVGIKKVGGVTYAIANGDDRNVYDLVITLKKE